MSARMPMFLLLCLSLNLDFELNSPIAIVTPF